MKVQAKWQIAYKDQSYKGGDIFELDEADFEQYKNDVIVVEEGEKKQKAKKNNKKAK